MRLPGRKLLVRSARWMRGRMLGGVLVLGYHRLNGDEQDPFGIGVSRSDFRVQLEIIVRRARPLSLSRAVQALREQRLPKGSVVVTFDDGYNDTIEQVLPLLERVGVPATVFVTTGTPGQPFWWDELAALLRPDVPLPARLALDIRRTRHVWSVPAATSNGSGRVAVGRRAVLHSLAAAVRLLSITERNEVLSGLRRWSGHDRVPSHRSLMANEIQRLAASGLIEIGAHSVSHPVLRWLPAEDQRAEIVRSRQTLQELTGKPVAAFSYPNGSYSEITIDEVRRAGFTAACCSTPDLATPHANLFALPRHWVRASDAGRFERWLDRWLPR